MIVTLKKSLLLAALTVLSIPLFTAQGAPDDRKAPVTQRSERKLDVVERHRGVPRVAKEALELDPYEAPKGVRRGYQERIESAVSRKLDYVPEQYVVCLKDSVFPYELKRLKTRGRQLLTEDGVSLQKVAEILVSKNSGELLEVWEGSLSGFSARLSEKAVRKLSRNPLVESIEKDGLVSAQFATSE